MTELVRNDAALPVKVKGKHRWVLTLLFAIGDSVAENIVKEEDEALALSTGKQCVSGVVGCLDCGDSLEAAYGTECTAGPDLTFEPNRN